ncbi:MAG: competence/damage-inducible protein A [Polyangia bacterium]
MSEGVPTRLAEVLTIGDELCRGEIVDTNSAYLAERLTSLGLHVRWRTSVTDDPPDMADAIRRASGRAHVVVTSGGLGPTDDDRTVDVLCGLLDVEAVDDAAHATRMRERFEARNLALTPNNLRQVRIPRGATVLPNPTGIAPGFTVELGMAHVSCMPGVPREMKPMFEQGLVPSLIERVGTQMVTRKRAFKLAGVGESHVDHALRGLLDGSHDVTLHFRIAFPENIVTLVVRRLDAGAADAELERLTAEVQSRLGAHIYGRDDDTLAGAVGARLVERKQTVGLAESCTGGMLGSMLTEAAGSSRYFTGAVVAYDNEVKIAQLGVDRALIVRDGAVSESVACAMAAGARETLRTTWALSITGVAGPDGGSTEKPVGTVWLGIAGPDGVRATKTFWPGEREQVRRMASTNALHLLWKALG